MAASLNQIHMMVGELTATAKATNEKIDKLTRDLSDSDAKSEKSRANVHRRLDEVVLRTSHLENDMLSVKNKVEGMEIITDDVARLRHQAEGAGTLGHWLVKIGLGVIWLAGVLAGAYTWLTGRPPP